MQQCVAFLQRTVAPMPRFFRNRWIKPRIGERDRLIFLILVFIFYLGPMLLIKTAGGDQSFAVTATDR
jgi:hypothetical protein